MVWEECRRICCSRLLWLFLMGSMVVNLWIVWNFQEQQEYVEISRKLAESGVLWLDQENVEEILQAFAGSQGGDPGKIPVQNILEGTLHLIREFAAADLADTYILSRKLQGDAAAYARKVYATLEPVIEENRQDKTARGFFVPCGGRFFDLYSRWLSLALTVESILGSVLLMMRCVNEPFDQRTGAEIYASRLGRRIQAVKGRAAIMVSTGCTVAVWAMTMGMAGVVFPLGKLWDTRLGSMMVLDTFFPLVTRFPVSIRGYLGLQFLVCWCVACLFGGLAYVAVTASHRILPAVGKLALICFGVAVLTQVFPRKTVLYFVLRFNPVDFAGKAGRWFASGGSFLSARGYEVLFVVFWGVVVLGWCRARNCRFLKEDL